MSSTSASSPPWSPYPPGMEKLADLQIVVGGSTVPLHSQCLAQCKVLCKLFEDTPALGWSQAVQAVLDKADDPETLRVFLHILYCGSAAEVLPDPVLPEQLESVFKLADLLDAARAVQVLESFLAAMDISKLSIDEKELQWLKMADKFGARRLRGKVLADLVPKLRTSFTQYSLDGAWRELSSDTQLLLVEAAFSSLATLESEVYTLCEVNEGAVSWADVEALRYFPVEEDLAGWGGPGGLH